jgi:hypothetical protein
LVLSNVDIATQPCWRFEATTSSQPIVVAEAKLEGYSLHRLGVIFHDAQLLDCDGGKGSRASYVNVARVRVAGTF